MQSRLLLGIGIALLLCTSATRSYSQVEQHVFFNFGYASFWAKDMKDQMIDAQKTDRRLKITSNYPAYFMYSGGIAILIKEQVLITAFGGHTSTGGSLSYGDYSGHIYQDMNVKTNFLGLSGAKKVYTNGKNFKVFGGLRQTFYLHRLEFVYDKQIRDDKDHQAYTFDSKSLGFEPYLTFMRSFGPLMARIEGGFDIQIPGKIIVAGGGGALINTTSNQPMKFNGSGFRLNAGLSFRFQKHERD